MNIKKLENNIRNKWLMVGRAGFEPATNGLKVYFSNLIFSFIFKQLQIFSDAYLCNYELDKPMILLGGTSE